MDNLIYYALEGLYGGALTYTLGKFAFKLKSNPQIEFNRTYLLTMLLSMIAVVALTPLATLPDLRSLSMVPNGLSFAVAASFAAGITVNALLNWPITYWINKIETYKKATQPSALPAKITSPTNIHRILELVIIAILVIALLGTSVFAVVTYTASISGTGSITGVGVSIYSDAQGQVSLNAINWGNVPPSGSVTTSIYVKSTGNTPITLYLSTANWTPASIASKLTLTWNYNNATLQPGSIARIDLTLAATTDAPQGTSFTYNMIITAMG